MYYVMYSYNKVSSRKENVIKKIMEEEVRIQDLLGETNCILSGPAQFKLVSFEGQPYYEEMNKFCT